MAAHQMLHALVTSFVMPPARHGLNAPSRPSLTATVPRMIAAPGAYSPRYTHYHLGSEYSPYNNGRNMPYYRSPQYSPYSNSRYMQYPPYYSSYNNGRYSAWPQYSPYNNGYSTWPQYSSYNNGRYMNYPAQDRLTARLGLVGQAGNLLNAQYAASPYNGRSMFSPYNGRFSQHMYNPRYYSPYNTGRYPQHMYNQPYYSPYHNGRYSRNTAWPLYSPNNNGRSMHYPTQDRLTARLGLAGRAGDYLHAPHSVSPYNGRYMQF